MKSTQDGAVPVDLSCHYSGKHSLTVVRHKFSLLAALTISIALLGCGGGSGSNGGGGTPPPTPTITSVTVSCPSATVPTGQTSQCSVTVAGTGSFSSAVSWSVSGTTGGNSTVGTVSAAGLYTAPSAVPTPYTVSVSATSTADSTMSGSSSIIVAGTIASLTQQITAAAGGTITLPDSSSVTIAAGALPADQSVTLTEVSSLAQQPPNTSITSVGPALELAFSDPIVPPASSATPAQHESGLRPATAGSTTATAFSFAINVAENNNSALSGSVPLVNFVGASGNLYAGTSGTYDSTTQTVAANVSFNVWGALNSLGSTVSSIELAPFNLAKDAWRLVTAPHQLSLNINSSDSSKDSWGDYKTCPTGKTLLVIHGMNDYVEQGFTTAPSTGAPQGVIQPILLAGGYNSALGFDYDWTQGINASGVQLASFLSTVAQCPGVSLDIEGHSEGNAVSLSALVQLRQSNPGDLSAIKHVVTLGGPIMGTPMADDATNILTLLANYPILNVPSSIPVQVLADLNALPFISDLKTSTPGQNDTLDAIRKSLSSRSTASQPAIIVVAGNNPVANTTALGTLMAVLCKAVMGNEGCAASDGFIPIVSALAFQPGVQPAQELGVYPLPPVSTDHLDLMSNGDVVSAVGHQVNNAFLPPSLNIEATSQCADLLVCSGPPGTAFAMVGGGYTAGGTVYDLALYTSGSIQLNQFPSPDTYIDPGVWQYQSICSSGPGSVMFSAQDATTGLASNAVTAETTSDACVSPPIVSVSPTSAQISVNGTQQFVAAVSNSSLIGVTWSVNGASGGNSTVGTITSTGLYTAPAIVPASGTVTVTATLAADSLVSGSALVTITASTGNPPPTVTGLLPSTLPAGSPSQTLAINGTGFLSSSTVTFNDISHVVTYVSSTQLTISLVPADLASTGSFPVIVTNPPPGGGSSLPGSFIVSSAEVTISPTSVSVPEGDVQTFGATVSGGGTVTWSIQEGTAGGAITSAGIYAAPSQLGTYHVIATDSANAAQTATATVNVVAGPTITTIHSFDYTTEGANPSASLILTSSAMYGTTEAGGNLSCSYISTLNGCGTIFQTDTSGDVTTLHSFAGSDGAYPVAKVLSATNGALYGTTLYGGSNISACHVGGTTTLAGCGTIFEYNSGVFTSIYSFGPFTSPIGVGPEASLTQAANGTLYGTAITGGNTSCTGSLGSVAQMGCGAVFDLEGSGSPSPLHDFGGSEGAFPATTPLLVNGNFYGTTASGGNLTCSSYASPGCGTVFEITSSGSLSSVHSFSGQDGAEPNGALVLGTDGNLYGSTFFGGNTSCTDTGQYQGCGTLFRIDASGNFTMLHSFSGLDGANPGSLMQASDGYFYGTTYGGGDLSCSGKYGPGCGVVFRMDLAGNVTVLYAFTGESDGSWPAAGMIQGSDGNLYGTAQYGGANDDGVIFKVANLSSLSASGEPTVAPRQVVTPSLVHHVHVGIPHPGMPRDGGYPR